ncbi:hypothetical protein GCM10010435_96390 [Winogradskya consettensis]|uniref:Uncharacterized protein n=1 Tax=Winogradskya consettensis TaxID=113560 RepID=A0A919W1V5_9ACTN|nr:hypothetical protein [Actinoplanes consettensis]GIM84271.1 hypothetical protein Aco04nite_90660 [Actinoplanes consettensis]
MSVDRGAGRLFAGVAVAGVGGGLLALAVVAVLSPAFVVGLAPAWFTDHGTARVVLRVAGLVAVVLAAAGLVWGALWARAAGHLPEPGSVLRTAVRALPGVVVVAVWLGALVLAFLADTEPGRVHDAAPGLLGEYASIDDVMLGTGLVIVGVPAVVAMVAGLRGAKGAAGFLAVLAVVLVLPAVLLLRDGRNALQDERRSDRTECVYFVGGYDCPDA